MKFGLSPSQIEEICAILCQQAAIEVAWVYGSRAKGTHSPQSDLDLALEGTAIDSKTVSRLTLDFDESSLPIRVDMQRLTACPNGISSIKNAGLLAHIQRVGKVIYRRQHPPTA